MLLKYLKFLKFPANMMKAIFYSHILDLTNIKLGKSTFSSTKLSSHISNAKFSRNRRVQPGSFNPAISLFYFYPVRSFLRLTPVHVETQYESPMSSIESF